MVAVGGKAVTDREATACGYVKMQPKTLRAIASASLPKGNVVAAAQLAGISAAKHVWELVPLCHPLPINSAAVDLIPEKRPARLRIEATVQAQARTGVEMEALAAVAAAALTVYDMCKAIDPGMEIGPIHLLRKSGGKSGLWRRKVG
jgi:cyclic pyranopterin phosphate synthase